MPGGVRGLKRPNLPERGKVRKDVRTGQNSGLEGADHFVGAPSTSAPAQSEGDDRGGAIQSRYYRLPPVARARVAAIGENKGFSRFGNLARSDERGPFVVCQHT